MSLPGVEEDVLSREELDALLDELPALAERETERARRQAANPAASRLALAHERFAADQSLTLSNLYQRVISISLLGQREIEMAELSELMLSTDRAGCFRVTPGEGGGFVLVSRPLFFHLLSMTFGASPDMKPIRPPSREYTRIEQRFFDRTARELLGPLESALHTIFSVGVEWQGSVRRSQIAEIEDEPAWLATFDVKGFAEPCRIRIAVPRAALTLPGSARSEGAALVPSRNAVSVLGVPIELAAEVGTAELSLGDVARLAPGDVIPLEVPSDGSLTIRIGDRAKFRAIAGIRGSHVAVQLGERLEAMEIEGE